MVDFLTPVGRFVQGDAFTPQEKDKAGNQLTVKKGINAGQPAKRWFMAVAFAKTDAAFGAMYQQMQQVARASFPTLFDAAGNCIRPNFAWKLVDGDGIDDDGKPNNQKPGFAGHWVLKFSSGYAPKCFHAGHYAPHEQIQDPKAIPRGYYVRVAGTIEGNGDTAKPGLYLNLNMVELVGGNPGDVIVSGPDAGAVFGASAPVLPAGVTLATCPTLPGMAPTPAPAMPGAPGVPPAMPSALPGPGAMAPAQAPMYAPAAPVMPAPAMAGAAPAVPSVPVVPNAAILAGPGVPTAPGLTPAPAAPAMPAPGFTMTAAAGGFTREQYHAQGWTDDQLRANGMMV